MPQQPLPLPRGYAKRCENENDLVAKLLARKLVVKDENGLRRILRAIGYYRLTGYLYPFRKDPDRSEDFMDGTTLDHIWNIYKFDRRLRLVVMDALARIEVAIRVRVMEAHSAVCGGDPFAYCNPAQLPGLNGQKFAKFLESLDKSVRQSFASNDPPVATHFKNHGQSRVPVWILMETLSFGDVCIYYQGLPHTAQQQVANAFGIWPSAFRSWLDVLRRVRNICAHQGRLWNRKINFPLSYNFSNSAQLADLYTCVSIQTALPYTTLFTALSLCAWMLHLIRPESLWQDRLKDLIAEFPAIPLADMGFPANWQQLTLWR